VAGSLAGARIILVIEYDGTNYHGSQMQADAPTIQGEIEKALKQLSGERKRIKTASRTDAGVHALGQVICFDTANPLPLKTYQEGMNHYLPLDIAVKEVYQTHEAFDVRRRAVSREYRYTILNTAARSPLRQNSYRVYGELDVDAMEQACRKLIGRHNFASFVASELIARQKQTVRIIFSAAITRDGDSIYFDVVANAFLTHQVRNIVGSLIKVGQGKMTVDEFENIVQAAKPGLAGPTVPASGLCLVRVNYPRPLKGEE
jgi:tRNA pseudouridine38-40 synthase